MLKELIRMRVRRFGPFESCQLSSAFLILPVCVMLSVSDGVLSKVYFT